MRIQFMVVTCAVFVVAGAMQGCGGSAENADVVDSGDEAALTDIRQDSYADTMVHQDLFKSDSAGPDSITTDSNPDGAPDVAIQDNPANDDFVTDYLASDGNQEDVGADAGPDNPGQDTSVQDAVCVNEDGSLCCDDFMDCTGRLVDRGEDLCHPAVCVDHGCAVGPETVCTASDSCHSAGVCDPATGQCDSPMAADGTYCPEGACQQGTCTNLCVLPCKDLTGICVDSLACDIHTGECPTRQSPDGTACDWDGTCVQGYCLAVADGKFQNNGYWTVSGSAEVDTASAGNNNRGAGVAETGTSWSFSQTLPLVPDNLRLRAGLDIFVHCGSINPYSCGPGTMGTIGLSMNGTVEARFNPSVGLWTGYSSCLGEAAFGTDVEFEVSHLGSMIAGGSYKIDNVFLEVTDDQTCPGVGEVLNGDMKGTFGWSPCDSDSGSLSYHVDGSVPYVQITGVDNQHNVSCMSTWFSSPLVTTMSHQALKFEYRTSGEASEYYWDLSVYSEGGDLQYQGMNSSSWKSVTVCIPPGLAGKARKLEFARGAGSLTHDEFIAVKNVRIVSDAGNCL